MAEHEHLDAALLAATEIQADRFAERLSKVPKLVDVFERVLAWPNPNGTIEEYYLPPWLAAEARKAIDDVKHS
jgi:mannose/cellobiose epimerase-like protein (N-acyl-D-glucosamine 2-epimerase family)